MKKFYEIYSTKINVCEDLELIVHAFSSHDLHIKYKKSITINIAYII